MCEDTAVSERGSETQLFEACKSGDLETVQALLEREELLEIRHSKGWTPLIVAVHSGHDCIVEYLLDKGANVNADNGRGTTVFMYAKSVAAKSGDFRTMERLVSAGAQLNARDRFGKTALDYADDLGCRSVVEFMEANGAQRSISR